MRINFFLLPALLPMAVMAEVPQVMTDIPAVHSLVAQVMGDLGTPTLLLEKGADEHDFQLRPSQMQGIAEADLVIWIGPLLTPWLDRALDGTKAGMVSLPLMELGGTQTLTYADNSLNPHLWMNPENAGYWVDMIAVELAQADPENAATYTANAATAKAGLTALDTELAALLAPVKDRRFVTYHDAYGYFTTHFGLTLVGTVAAGDASEPGAAHLAELQKTIRDVTCVFPEAQHDPALMLQLLEGSTARVGGVLDPVGSTLEPGPLAYDTLLRSMATTLAECLNGA